MYSTGLNTNTGLTGSTFQSGVGVGRGVIYGPSYPSAFNFNSGYSTPVFSGLATPINSQGIPSGGYSTPQITTPATPFGLSTVAGINNYRRTPSPTAYRSHSPGPPRNSSEGFGNTEVNPGRMTATRNTYGLDSTVVYRSPTPPPPAYPVHLNASNAATPSPPPPYNFSPAVNMSDTSSILPPTTSTVDTSFNAISGYSSPFVYPHGYTAEATLRQTLNILQDQIQLNPSGVATPAVSTYTPTNFVPSVTYTPLSNSHLNVSEGGNTPVMDMSGVVPTPKGYPVKSKPRKKSVRFRTSGDGQKEVDMTVTSNQSVKDIKHVLAQTIKVPPQLQRLLFRGNVVDDNIVIADSPHVPDNACMYVITQQPDSPQRVRPQPQQYPVRQQPQPSQQPATKQQEKQEVIVRQVPQQSDTVIRSRSDSDTSAASGIGGRFTVKIQNLGGVHMTSIEVYPSDTLLQLKEKFAEICYDSELQGDFGSDTQAYLFTPADASQSIMIEHNHMTLAEYGIDGDNNLLTYVRCWKGGGSPARIAPEGLPHKQARQIPDEKKEEFVIYIQEQYDQKDSVFPLSVQPHNTLAQVKEKIFQLKQIPVESQSYIFNPYTEENGITQTTVLEDDNQTLSYYKIGEGACLVETQPKNEITGVPYDPGDKHDDVSIDSGGGGAAGRESFCVIDNNTAEKLHFFIDEWNDKSVLPLRHHLSDCTGYPVNCLSIVHATTQVQTLEDTDMLDDLLWRDVVLHLLTSLESSKNEEDESANNEVRQIHILEYSTLQLYSFQLPRGDQTLIGEVKDMITDRGGYPKQTQSLKQSVACIDNFSDEMTLEACDVLENNACLCLELTTQSPSIAIQQVRERMHTLPVALADIVEQTAAHLPHHISKIWERFSEDIVVNDADESEEDCEQKLRLFTEEGATKMFTAILSEFPLFTGTTFVKTTNISPKSQRIAYARQLLDILVGTKSSEAAVRHLQNQRFNANTLTAPNLLTKKNVVILVRGFMSILHRACAIASDQEEDLSTVDSDTSDEEGERLMKQQNRPHQVTYKIFKTWFYGALFNAFADLFYKGGPVVKTNRPSKEILGDALLFFLMCCSVAQRKFNSKTAANVAIVGTSCGVGNRAVSF